MDDLLQCPICYIEYNYEIKTPKQLDCQHILCNQCLPYMVKVAANSSFIECPICKTKTHKSISDVPRSLIILQIIEANKSNKPLNKQIPQIPPRPSVQAPPLPPLPTSFPSSPPTLSQVAPYARNSPSPELTKNSNSNAQWDLRTFLRNIFNEMDLNRDGSITIYELQEALKRGQGSEFSLKTIDLLITKYDKNGDREISFDEFYDLYINLNSEFENFLLTDSDGSGSIDMNELAILIAKKGHHFSQRFFKFIVDEITKHTGKNGIKFDNFMRIVARFDYLIDYYNKTSFFHKYPLETYLKNTFFQDFW